MRSLPLDLRLALRTFARNRSFAATTIATLALGIGATSAIFSVIYGVLLKPLPYRDPGRLVRVYEQIPAERLGAFPLSPADFRDYRRQNRVFESIAAYVRQDQQYGGEHPQRLIGMRVSHGFFHLLGVEPQLGRAFTQEEESNPARPIQLSSATTSGSGSSAAARKRSAQSSGSAVRRSASWV
jgi:putative ABC transport system permease protein